MLNVTVYVCGHITITLVEASCIGQEGACIVLSGIAVVDKKIYLCGGICKSNAVFTHLCESFDVDTLQWQQVPSLPAAIYQCAAAGANGRVYLSGGQVTTSRTTTGQLLSFKPGWFLLPIS